MPGGDPTWALLPQGGHTQWLLARHIRCSCRFFTMKFVTTFGAVRLQHAPLYPTLPHKHHHTRNKLKIFPVVKAFHRSSTCTDLPWLNSGGKWRRLTGNCVGMQPGAREKTCSLPRPLAIPAHISDLITLTTPLLSAHF